VAHSSGNISLHARTSKNLGALATKKAVQKEAPQKCAESGSGKVGAQVRGEDVKRLNEFLKEFQGETDRGAALIGTTIIDNMLAATIEAFLVVGKASKELLYGSLAPIHSFASRINLAFALGLINEHEHSESNLIRKIRNEFAHRGVGLAYSDPKINALCDRLKSDLPGGSPAFIGKPRDVFVNAVILIHLALHYSAAWVEKERRTSKNWPY
jgi:hypothetical protein